MRHRMVWLLDAAFLLALAGYVLAGRDRVPFHGDESMLIYMSRDYYTLVQAHDLDAVLCCAPPGDTMAALDEHLRIVNGTVSKMTIGLAWDAAGMTVRDLNGPWFWGVPDEWAWNVAHGGLPGEHLLHVARTPSALFTALSVWAVFGIARCVTRARPAAYAASAIYATSPAVLLNGRRAMMEGSLLLFTALAVLAVIFVVSEEARGPSRCRALLARSTLFGVACGLALASKHTAAITVAALFVAMAAEPLVRRGRTLPDGRHILRWLALGGVALLVFLALNPAWWSDPLGMPGRVLDQRRSLLDGQIQGAKAAGQYYTSAGDRLAGLVNQTLLAGPQFYEAPYWEAYVGDQAAAYRASGLAGRGSGPIWGVLLAALCVPGVIAVVRHWRDGPTWVVLVWTGVTALALLILTPFEWQRYYLLLQAPLAVIAGIGAGRIVRHGGRYVLARMAVRADSGA
jgi:4-amino-4-deoxy-L-arabinose transferase-like glycosyltransferase